MGALSCRRLSPEVQADVQACQFVLEHAPGYHLLVEGQLPGPGAAKSELLELPPGISLGEKYSYLIAVGDEPVGYIDLVKGYPAQAVAFIGLLLFVESCQGRGYGPAALAFIKAQARSWGCSSLRIAVISTNERALKFWSREGFSEIERKRSTRFTGDAVVMGAAV